MTVRGIDLPPKPDVWLDDGIVYADLRGSRHLTPEMVRYIYAQRRRLAGRRRLPMLLLAREILTIDFEVQLLASRPDWQYLTTAIAIVGESFMLKHFVTVFTSYHAPDYPVAFFTASTEAVAWLTEIKDQQEAF